MDLFGMSASQASEQMAKLISAAKGRVDVESMFEAFQSGAPALVKLGIDADTATKALVALLDKGIAPGRAGKMLTTFDAQGMRLSSLTNRVPGAVRSNSAANLWNCKSLDGLYSKSRQIPTNNKVRNSSAAYRGILDFKAGDFNIQTREARRASIGKK